MNKNKSVLYISIISKIIGVLMIVSGIGGLLFVSQSVKQENIITPNDASIPNTLVHGPMTLKSQADIIRFHTLNTTNNRTYAEMSRDEDRSIWITATSLTAALNLAILAYAVSLLSIAVGLCIILISIMFKKILK